MMSSSAELSLRNLQGDMLALFAGLLYAGYLISVERAREKLAPLPLLFLASAFGAAMLLPFSIALGETVVPADWTFIVVLAISSQVIGQGLLVYAIGALPPLVVGLALLTQQAISALVGWLSTSWSGRLLITVVKPLALASAISSVVICGLTERRSVTRRKSVMAPNAPGCV